MKKRFLSVLLCVCMVLTLTPTMVFADEGTGETEQLKITLDYHKEKPIEVDKLKLTKNNLDEKVTAVSIPIELDTKQYRFTGALENSLSLMDNHVTVEFEHSNWTEMHLRSSIENLDWRKAKALTPSTQQVKNGVSYLNLDKSSAHTLSYLSKPQIYVWMSVKKGKDWYNCKLVLQVTVPTSTTEIDSVVIQDNDKDFTLKHTIDKSVLTEHRGTVNDPYPITFDIDQFGLDALKTKGLILKTTKRVDFIFYGSETERKYDANTSWNTTGGVDNSGLTIKWNLLAKSIDYTEGSDIKLWLEVQGVGEKQPEEYSNNIYLLTIKVAPVYIRDGLTEFEMNNSGSSELGENIRIDNSIIPSDYKSTDWYKNLDDQLYELCLDTLADWNMTDGEKNEKKSLLEQKIGYDLDEVYIRAIPVVQFEYTGLDKTNNTWKLKISTVIRTYLTGDLPDYKIKDSDSFETPNILFRNDMPVLDNDKTDWQTIKVNAPWKAQTWQKTIYISKNGNPGKTSSDIYNQLYDLDYEPFATYEVNYNKGIATSGGFYFDNLNSAVDCALENTDSKLVTLFEIPDQPVTIHKTGEVVLQVDPSLKTEGVDDKLKTLLVPGPETLLVGENNPSGSVSETGIVYEFTKNPDYTPTGTVITETTTGGTIGISDDNAKAGDTVTITATPDNGYEVDNVSVTGSDESNIEVKTEGENTYTFTMPEVAVQPVTVTVTFKESDQSNTAPNFVDVVANTWYSDAVNYVVEKGLMEGTSATTFEPNTTTTRGMVVTILHRLEGSPSATAAGFSDVPSGQWYSDAVAWAASNGIVTGYDNGNFGPNDMITREQMATILYRYAATKGYNTSSTTGLTAYVDASAISPYANTAMSWATATGLIKGTSDNTLSPAGDASRAEVATILMRFCENVAK